MRQLLSSLGPAIRRRPGLTWVLATTCLMVASSLAPIPPAIRVVPVLIFVLTVPGFLILDLDRPEDLTAKIAMGVAGSVSLYIVLVSISLLADPFWLVPAAVVFTCAAALALRHRRKADALRLELIDGVGRVDGHDRERADLNDTSGGDGSA